MRNKAQPTIYTIGHSTHSSAVFLNLLQSFSIQILVDIRRLPGSRKYPQFNQDQLRSILAAANITYVYLEALGGRRKADPHSKNDRWRNLSFKGYADYMGTTGFKIAVNELTRLASEKPTAYMCSEAVWWRCHRSMVSDYLKAHGWKVLHIMTPAKAPEHPYTAAARVFNNTVCYSNDDQFCEMHTGPKV